MMTSQTGVEELVQSDDLYYHTQINKIAWQVIPDFDKCLKRYVGFHFLFFTLFASEIALLGTFSKSLIESSLFAVGLAGIVLSVFAYFVLKVYLQGEKEKRIFELEKRYVKVCKQLLHYEEGVYEHHLTLANAYCLLETRLQNRESSYYQLPKWLEILSSTMKRFSSWWHFQDVHQMRELLLKGAIEEHVKLVKYEPTSLQMHAALANAYVRLSGVYRVTDEEWMPEGAFAKELRGKFRKSAKRAIEEFKILNDFAPDEPWVHAQLAYSYRDLKMPKEEIREYETILTLRPTDRDTLFKLGVLYFQQGENAKGLRIYEKLKRVHYKLADRLIEYYGV